MRRPRTVLAALAIAGLLGFAAHAAGQGTAAQTALLRVAFPSEDGSLTPYTFTNGYALMSLVYDTLTWRDVNGVARPWLAQSVDRAGRTVTVRLRPNVRWQDGRPLTAADVVFTYRYMATHRHPRFTLQLRDIASVTARGPRTAVFALRRPSLGFEDQPLADVPIIPRHLWAKLPAGRLAPAGLPVGSGPYRLVRHDKGLGYVFEANDAYFRGRPLVKTIQVPIVGDQGVALDELRSVLPTRRLDLIPVAVPAGRPVRQFRSVSYDDAVSYAGTMLAFNLDRPPFDRLGTRRAVAHALDLTRIAGVVRGPGAQLPAERGAVDPRSPWAPATALHRYDAAAARLAFAEQGVAPFSVLASSADAIRLEAAHRVVGALRDAGAQAVLDVRAPAAFDRAIGRGGRTPMFQAAVVGMPALASYDPAYLRTLFGDPREASLNHSGYRSARFARADDRTAAARSMPARHAAVDAELRLLAGDLPALPLFYGGTTYAYRTLGYPDWASIPGTGILDKRSFVPGPRVTAKNAAAASGDLRDTSGDSGTSLVPFILGFAGLMLLGAAIWVVRGGSRPNRPPGRRSR